MADVPDLAQFATTFVIPTSVATKQDRRIVIGPNVYGRPDMPGVFAMKVYDPMQAVGLRRDGKWDKYGEPFDSPQQAYEAVLATNNVHWGDDL